MVSYCLLLSFHIVLSRLLWRYQTQAAAYPLPDFSGNVEIELTGLQDITSEDKELVDAHAERYNEVDCEQLSLSHIDEVPPSADPSPSQISKDTMPSHSPEELSSFPAKSSPSKSDDGLTDCESVSHLYFSSLHATSLPGHESAVGTSQSYYACFP